MQDIENLLAHLHRDAYLLRKARIAEHNGIRVYLIPIADSIDQAVDLINQQANTIHELASQPEDAIGQEGDENEH